MNQPVESPESPLVRPLLLEGAAGPWVEELQALLTQAGYVDVPTAGVFDEATRRAVVLFQMQHIDAQGFPLRPDGKVGPKTWWALQHPSGDAQRNFLPTPPPVQGLSAARQRVIDIAVAEHTLGVREEPDGSNGGPEVDKYLRPAGVLRVPWCCGFVSWVLRQALGRSPIGNVHHLGVQRMWWMAQQLGLGTGEPKPGDVFIQIKDQGTGHTGLVVGLSADEQTIYTCEGNCGNRVKLGRRPRASIHHFIDAVQDGQGPDFGRGSNFVFEEVDADGTR